uniref:Nibrin n=1 Tax=Neogobius melanostomus TaxID=47308 RepID=A0A8C6TYC7_9GOBI
MWILTPLLPGGETHYLLSGKKYVVGRKNCDILLSDDQSISRAHALLSASEQTLTLKDTSKYGSFVNGQRVAENTSVNLTSRSDITFGVFNSKFSVEKLAVCSSCLDNDGKASLSQDCTHLVMSTVKVTIKTICALLCGRPIVKPDFFSALRSAIQNQSPPPEAERFLPEIDEPSLNKEEVNVEVIQRRKELFAGKIFVFLNAKQMKRLSAAVSFGGGTCRLLEEGALPRDVLESAQTCVVEAVTGSSQPVLSSSAVEWIKSVKSIVEMKGLRVITESEIGLAAIYASCEKHCNSSHLTHGGETVCFYFILYLFNNVKFRRIKYPGDDEWRGCPLSLDSPTRQGKTQKPGGRNEKPWGEPHKERSTPMDGQAIETQGRWSPFSRRARIETVQS